MSKIKQHNNFISSTRTTFQHLTLQKLSASTFDLPNCSFNPTIQKTTQKKPSTHPRNVHHRPRNRRSPPSALHSRRSPSPRDSNPAPRPRNQRRRSNHPSHPLRHPLRPAPQRRVARSPHQRQHSHPLQFRSLPSLHQQRRHEQNRACLQLLQPARATRAKRPEFDSDVGILFRCPHRGGIHG